MHSKQAVLPHHASTAGNTWAPQFLHELVFLICSAFSNAPASRLFQASSKRALCPRHMLLLISRPKPKTSALCGTRTAALGTETIPAKADAARRAE